MDLIRFSINNPVKVAVGVLLVILFGLISVYTIPIQLVPDVDEPIITVQTEWTGRSPQEIEKDIIEEQEDKLKSLANLKKMVATASQGQANIELEFYIGTDISRALQEVSDKLREVPDYPDDVDEPVIEAADGASENAIAWVILDSTDPDYDIQSLYDFADKRIKPRLERVSGLSEVNVYGGREREVHVRLDPGKVAHRGITFNELANALSNDNTNVSAGDLVDGRLDVRIRTVGQYDALDQIANTVVRHDDGDGPIRVKDLGDVVLTLEKRRSFVRANGKPALAINAIRETGANVITAMEGFKEGIADINQNILPYYENDRYGLRMRQVYDETVYIYDAISLVQTNLWIGGVLAVCVLLLFLRSIRPTVIVALAIPVSVVGTFVVMTAAGRNVNVISLAGMAFAVGMVVDNAIVVIENIDRHLKHGKTPREAAYAATKEVWGAILASTLTTIAVFVPVLTIEEEAGQLFFDISLAICAAVTLSLIVSVSVIPSASARWLRQPVAAPSQLRKQLVGLFGLIPLFKAFGQGYANLIHRLTAPTALRFMSRLAIVAVFTIVSLGLSYSLMPPASYLPAGNQNLIFGIMLTPPAYNIEQAQFIGERIEHGVRPYWEVDTIEEATALGPVVNFFTGETYPRVPAIKNYFYVSFDGTIFMGAQSIDDELVKPLAPILSNSMMAIPGSFGFAMQRSIFGRGLSGTNGIDIEITGSDLDRVRGAAEVLYMALTGTYGFMNVQPDPLNFNLSGPELQFKIDQVKAKDMGIDTAAIGAGIRALVDGLVIGDYRLEGENIDLLLTRHPEYNLSVDELRSVPVTVFEPGGARGVVPISEIGTFVETTAPQQIKRIELLRAISFTVTPPGSVPLEAAQDDIMQTVAGLREAGAIPPDVAVAPAGTADKLRDVRRALLGHWTGFNLESIFSLITSRFFLALLITFLLMAALFESFIYPLVIMFTVPLATVGGFLGLALMHAYDPTQQLDTLTMLGFVILVGIVVNNAILIVHQALNFMRGVSESEDMTVTAMQPREAIAESVRTRIRPIFMTTCTSVFGMLPLVLMPGAGSELYKGLGSVVVGGLIVSTLFTLVVVPLLFSVVLDIKAWLFGALGWRMPEARATAGI